MVSKQEILEKPYVKPYDPLAAIWQIMSKRDSQGGSKRLEKIIKEQIGIWLTGKKRREASFDDQQINDIVEDVIEIAKLWGCFFVANSGEDAEKADSLLRDFDIWLQHAIDKICLRELYFSNWKLTFFCIWGESIPDDEKEGKKIQVRDYIFERILTPFWKSKLLHGSTKPSRKYAQHDCFKTLSLIDEKYQEIIKDFYLNGVSPTTTRRSKLLREAQATYFKHLLRALWRPLTLEIERDRIRWAINQLAPDEARIAEMLRSYDDLSKIDRELQLRGRKSFKNISYKVKTNIEEAWAYDLHVHTRRSDGAEFPSNLITLQYIKNLDGVAIMDHQFVGKDSLKEYIKSCTEYGWGKLLIGQEVEASGGYESGVELSGIFFDLNHNDLINKTEEELQQTAQHLSFGNELSQSIEKLADKLLEAKATLVITHPYGRPYSLCYRGEEHFERLVSYLIKKGINPEESLIIEVFNAKNGPKDDKDHPNGKARKKANHYPDDRSAEILNFPISAGSDSHLGLFDMGTGYCIVRKPNEQGAKRFVENLKTALICAPRNYWFNQDSFRDGFGYIFKKLAK